MSTVNNLNYNFEISEKVQCFDPSAYVDDVKTPLSITMRDAVVIDRKCETHYGRWTKFYDVKFTDRVSTNHFESSLSKTKSL